LKQYFKLILIDLFGVFLAVTSRTSWLDNWIQALNFPLDPTKLTLFIISILLTVGYLNYTIISLKGKLEKVEKTRENEHKLLRKSYLQILEDEYKHDFDDCNIRIFLPKNNLVEWISNLFRKKESVQLNLYLKPIRVLCTDEIDKPLLFKVRPKELAQGMVGETFATETICIQQTKASRITNEFTSRMDQAQLALAHDYEFILTFPILDPKSGKLVGIASIDSKKPKPDLDIKSKDSLRNIVIKIGMEIHDSFIA